MRLQHLAPNVLQLLLEAVTLERWWELGEGEAQGEVPPGSGAIFLSKRQHEPVKEIWEGREVWGGSRLRQQ